MISITAIRDLLHSSDLAMNPFMIYLIAGK